MSVTPEEEIRMVNPSNRANSKESDDPCGKLLERSSLNLQPTPPSHGNQGVSCRDGGPSAIRSPASLNRPAKPKGNQLAQHPSSPSPGIDNPTPELLNGFM